MSATHMILAAGGLFTTIRHAVNWVTQPALFISLSIGVFILMFVFHKWWTKPAVWACNVFRAKIGGTYQLPRNFTIYLLSGLVPWFAFLLTMSKAASISGTDPPLSRSASHTNDSRLPAGPGSSEDAKPSTDQPASVMARPTDRSASRRASAKRPSWFKIAARLAR